MMQATANKLLLHSHFLYFVDDSINCKLPEICAAEYVEIINGTVTSGADVETC
jgi:hypothetical protein